MNYLLWRIRNRIGRRGGFLLFLAILDMIYGYFLLLPPASVAPQLYPLLPRFAWAICWLAVAAICVVGSVRKHDRLAYGFAALLKAGWGLRFAYLWYLGVPFSWVSMVIWLCFAGTVVMVSGWPEEIIKLPPGARR